MGMSSPALPPPSWAPRAQPGMGGRAHAAVQLEVSDEPRVEKTSPYLARCPTPLWQHKDLPTNVGRGGQLPSAASPEDVQASD